MADKLAQYAAALEECRACEAERIDLFHEFSTLHRRLRAELYGDGSAWHGPDDPRLIQALMEHPEVIVKHARMKESDHRMTDARMGLALARLSEVQRG